MSDETQGRQAGTPKTITIDELRKIADEHGVDVRNLLIARCDFCDRTELEMSGMMIGSPRPNGGSGVLSRAHICSDCVPVCAEIVEKRLTERKTALGSKE